MLKEHLTQDHNLASRSFELIDQQVDWIQNTVLEGQTTRILDLGCGPGLYSSRLASLGNTCTGIDFSSASIHFAKESAAASNLPCTYILEDLREAEYGSAFGLAMLLYGEFNVFSSADAALILRKAWHALQTGGLLLLEPQHLEAVRLTGAEQNYWFTSSGGLFSDQPHLYLEEHFWSKENSFAVVRYAVIDAKSGKLSLYSSSYQGYTPEQYVRLLEECGFKEVTFYPSLVGKPHPSLEGMIAVTARKAG
jgi:SAM-dependent methyltransferase